MTATRSGSDSRKIANSRSPQATKVPAPSRQRSREMTSTQANGHLELSRALHGDHCHHRLILSLTPFPVEGYGGPLTCLHADGWIDESAVRSIKSFFCLPRRTDGGSLFVLGRRPLPLGRGVPRGSSPLFSMGTPRSLFQRLTRRLAHAKLGESRLGHTLQGVTLLGLGRGARAPRRRVPFALHLGDQP